MPAGWLAAVTAESAHRTLDDVGVGVTDQLLDGLRQQVADKEITEPQELLDGLQSEMTTRLAGADRSLHYEPGDVASPNAMMHSCWSCMCRIKKERLDWGPFKEDKRTEPWFQRT